MPGVCLCHKEIDRFPSSSTAPKSEILGREVAKSIGTITDELDDALFDATEMIAYRVDCILAPEPGFECPEE